MKKKKETPENITTRFSLIYAAVCEQNNKEDKSANLDEIVGEETRATRDVNFAEIIEGE